jgi:hypothetical protein
MRKPERAKLAKRLLTLLSQYSKDITTRDMGGQPWSIETKLDSVNGPISVTAFLPQDAKSNPWLACRFDHWDAKSPNPWRGFDHWKQNIHGFDGPTVEQWLARVVDHLERLGVASPKLYDLHYVTRDRDGKELSREKVGGVKWVPMTHAEAITAKSKFSAARIELVEVTR